MVQYIYLEPRNCLYCGKELGYVTHASCSECRRKLDQAKKIKKVKRRVVVISFLLFPLGFLLYFLWKDKKPHYAKPALYSAISSLCLYIVINLLPYIVDL